MDFKGYVNYHLEKRREYLQRKRELKASIKIATSSNNSGPSNRIYTPSGLKSTRRYTRRSMRKTSFVPNPTIMTIFEEDEEEEDQVVPNIDVPEKDQVSGTSTASKLANNKEENKDDEEAEQDKLLQILNSEADGISMILQPVKVESAIQIDNEEIVTTAPDIQMMNEMGADDNRDSTGDDLSLGTLSVAICIIIIVILGIASLLYSIVRSANIGKVDYILKHML